KWFGIWDAETAASSLAVTATSSNTTLLPNANITFGGSGADRTFILNPASGQSGSTTITITVTDAQGQQTSTQFLYVVATANTINGDQDFSGEADAVRVVRNGTFLEVYRNNNITPVLHQDYASTGLLAVHALLGDDTITVDF